MINAIQNFLDSISQNFFEACLFWTLLEIIFGKLFELFFYKKIIQKWPYFNDKEKWIAFQIMIPSVCFLFLGIIMWPIIQVPLSWFFIYFCFSLAGLIALPNKKSRTRKKGA